ncbi:MAG: N-acetylmuramoyl-L-alanine amidase [Acidobacteriaceae bacterium]|nr:N-acetylmuramoyl-L-alanine amidase [Acidobacteriaceae bacterium]
MFRLPRRIVPVCVAIALVLSVRTLRAQGASAPRVAAIRFWSFGDVTRIAIQTEGEYALKSDQIDNPPRLYFDLNGLRPPSTTHQGVETIEVNDHRIKEIRVAQVNRGTTRIVFDLESPVEVVSSQLVNPDRLMIEVRPKGTSFAALSIAHTVMGSQRADVPIHASANPPVMADTSARSNVMVTSPVRQMLPVLPPPPPQSAMNVPAAPERAPLPVDSHPSAPPPAPLVVKAPGLASPAKRDNGGDRSLVRVLGLKLGKVVIDPGHGGHDTGTIGPNGLLEKDLVLDVAGRLGALITKQMGADVVYTRSSDVFIPLEDRTKIANEQKADLFISIHANSSPEPSATGVETYYFNLTSDKTGLDVATRENATAASSIADLNDLLHRAVLQAKLEESREFAQKVQAPLWTMSVKMNNHSKDRGVRQAPFVVLIGATMPSVLAEIGFVSNPHDEKLMRRSDQRQKIADALFKGVSQYANSLSHVQLARVSSH